MLETEIKKLTAAIEKQSELLEKMFERGNSDASQRADDAYRAGMQKARDMLTAKEKAITSNPAENSEKEAVPEEKAITENPLDIPSEEELQKLAKAKTSAGTPRAEIKAILTELGAVSITTLDEQAMVEFKKRLEDLG